MDKGQRAKKQKKWTVRLSLSAEEEKKIKKEAIDNEMRVCDYVKFKVLGNFPVSTEGKV